APAPAAADATMVTVLSTLLAATNAWLLWGCQAAARGSSVVRSVPGSMPRAVATAWDAAATSPLVRAATDCTSVVRGVTCVDPAGAVSNPVNARLVAVSNPPVSTSGPVVVPGPSTKWPYWSVVPNASSLSRTPSPLESAKTVAPEM